MRKLHLKRFGTFREVGFCEPLNHETTIRDGETAESNDGMI